MNPFQTIKSEYTQNAETLAKIFNWKFEVVYIIYTNWLKDDKKMIEITTNIGRN